MRDLCCHHGALVVYDELKTGFRAHLGGGARVQTQGPLLLGEVSLALRFTGICCSL
ncbi:MAG: hypothetical protein M3283_04540 [Actinomycetota bacterium]|nr:hypothetical protein [Actinomycetota bacterium]